MRFRRFASSSIPAFLFLAACSSTGTGSTAATTPSPTAAEPPATTTTTSDADESSLPVPIDGTDVLVTGCTWTWFGEYRIDAEWTGDQPPPAVLSFDAVFTRMTQGDIGLEFPAEQIVVDGADEFSFVVSSMLWPGNDGVHAFHGEHVPVGEPCQVEIGASSSAWHTIDIDLTPPTDAPAGTLQALAATADSLDAPMVTLGGLLVQLEDPPFDRLYVSASDHLAQVSVSTNATCIVIRQFYDVGPEVDGAAPQVEVVQERGCRAFIENELPVSIDDPNWIVEIYGEQSEANRVAAALISYDLDDAAAMSGPPFTDPGGFLDAWLAEEPDVVELTRVPHRDGMILVFRRDDGGRQDLVTNTLASATPPAVGSARPTLSCNEYTSGVSEGGTDGYAWFAAADPSTTIDVRLVDGNLAPVPLESVDEGLHLALVDQRDFPVAISEGNMEIVVLNGDGETVQCTQ